MSIIGSNKSKPSVLAIITARGGSKGLPGKNTRVMQGRPLLTWTVDAALKSDCIDRVILSTDDPKIAETGRAAGAEIPFLRPSSLATDTTGSVEVVEHAISVCGPYDFIVLLQPTSPLRHAKHIDAAFSQMIESKVLSCASITETPKPPWLMYELGSGKRLSPILDPDISAHRRQDYPTTYALNGAIYIVNTNDFLRERKFIFPTTVGYRMSQKDSIDIDNLNDFNAAEQQLKIQIESGLRAKCI